MAFLKQLLLQDL